MCTFIMQYNEDMFELNNKTIKRIFGSETEFGCMVRDPALGSSDQMVEVVKNWVFNKKKLGAIDLHARDEAFEPARSGGFLINGARLYIDAVGSHEEYATAECSELFDLVAQEKAGQRILVSALKEIELDNKVGFYNNSVDHYGGHTFGSHENYQIQAEDKFFSDQVHALWPFLVTRQIFSGVGRVGGHKLEHNEYRPNMNEMLENPIDYLWVSNIYGVEPDDTVEYQLSQRADHIVKTIASRVRFNRAIINPKWDSFYSSNSLHRLHLLFGEANMSEYATALKFGATCLVLDLIEAKAVPKNLRIADPLSVLKSVSRDSSWRWLVQLADDRTMPAVDIQRAYLNAAYELFSGRDKQTDWTLLEWEATLNSLERDPMELDDRIDWVIKRKILNIYREENNITWNDAALHSIDMEYHNVNPEQSLYYALEQMGEIKRIITDQQIENAMANPPQNTRALGRSMVIQKLIERKTHRYFIDWDLIYVDRSHQIELFDATKTYADEARIFFTSI